MGLRVGQRGVGSDFSTPLGSMAAMIETEFERIWGEVYDWPLPEFNREERRAFYVALARGIFRYLVEMEDSAENEHFANQINLEWWSGISIPYQIKNVEWNFDDI